MESWIAMTLALHSFVMRLKKRCTCGSHVECANLTDSHACVTPMLYVTRAAESDDVSIAWTFVVMASSLCLQEN